MIPWLLRRDRRAASSRSIELTPDERRTAHMAASLLLDYPEGGRRARFAQVLAVAARLPAPLAGAFARFDEETSGLGQGELEALYTSTFDEKRRCCPYLSYYAAGDTRRRGMALVRFAEAYREAGWQTASGELPDYLPLVLEFSARSDSPLAAELLGAHREGVEVLREALAGLNSPYRHLLDAVCLALPEVDEETRERYRALISDGPPAELVGLEKVPVALQPFRPAGNVYEEASL